MQVETTRLARFRPRELTPVWFTRLAVATSVALYAIIVTGATVRLTSSGLGCESWPGCEAGAFFPARDAHAFVEFGNRVFGVVPITLTLLAWLGARRTPSLSRWVVRLALATFVGTLAQAPLGRLTITFDLHPLLVMSHFLLALLVLAGAVVVALEARSHEIGRAPAIVPREVQRAGIVLVAACLTLVVTGTLSTAAGPHAGGADIRRLGVLTDMLYVHVRATALFGCVFLFVLGYLAAGRRRSPRLFAVTLALLGLVLLQMAVGEVQWRTELPWLVVLLHVAMAAAIWTATVVLAALFWRPPASFAAART